jgi:hypothetical protein
MLASAAECPSCIDITGLFLDVGTGCARSGMEVDPPSPQKYLCLKSSNPELLKKNLHQKQTWAACEMLWQWRRRRSRIPNLSLVILLPRCRACISHSAEWASKAPNHALESPSPSFCSKPICPLTVLFFRETVARHF